MTTLHSADTQTVAQNIRSGASAPFYWTGNGSGVTKPTNLADGDTVLIVLSANNVGTLTDPQPDGFTLIAQESNSTWHTLMVFAKDIENAAGEPANYAIYHDSWTQEDGFRHAYTALRLSGTSVDDIALVVGASQWASSATIVCPSIDTPHADCLVLGVAGGDGNTTHSPPAGWAEESDISSDGSGGFSTRSSHCTISQTFAALGATGDADVTQSLSSGSGGFQIALADLGTSSPGIFDDPDTVVVEVRRIDCNGTETIHVAPDPDQEGCFTDRFMPFEDTGRFCGAPDHECQVCYQVRWWGRLQGDIVVTDWSDQQCVNVSNPDPGCDWLRGYISGDINICPERGFVHTRPFGRFQPIGGGLPTVTSGTPGGRDYRLSWPVESEEDLVTCEDILAQTVVHYSPWDAANLFMAPETESIEVIQVDEVRRLQASFVAVETPPIDDPADLVPESSASPGSPTSP